MLVPALHHVKRRRELEYRLAVLDGHNPPGSERTTVAYSVNLIQHGPFRITGSQEIGVQGVDATPRPVMVHGPRRSHQRLTGHLPSEDPLPVIVR